MKLLKSWRSSSTKQITDDGPAPMDLGIVGAHAGKGAAMTGPNGAGTWHCGKELMAGRVAEEMMEERKEGRKAPRAANLIGTVTKTKDPMEAKATERTKPDIATIAESKGTSE